MPKENTEGETCLGCDSQQVTRWEQSSQGKGMADQARLWSAVTVLEGPGLLRIWKVMESF